MPFENFGQQFMGARMAGSSAITQFLKLDRAFKDAQRIQQYKDLESSRERAFKKETQTADIAASAPKEAAQTEYYQAQTRFLGEGGIDKNMSTEDSMSQAGIPIEQQSDYRVVPQTYTYRGKQKIISKLERKKDISQNTSSDITQMDNTYEVLNKNINMLQEKGITSGPGIVTRGGPTADITAQYLRSPEFATWKASTQRAFQLYRKWATGVAAGYPELQLLAPNYPKATDKPDVFISKSYDVMKDIEKNRNIMIKNLNKSGYAVSAFGNLGEQVQSSQNKGGKTSSGVGYTIE